MFYCFIFSISSSVSVCLFCVIPIWYLSPLHLTKSKSNHQHGRKEPSLHQQRKTKADSQERERVLSVAGSREKSGQTIILNFQPHIERSQLCGRGQTRISTWQKTFVKRFIKFK